MKSEYKIKSIIEEYYGKNVKSHNELPGEIDENFLIYTDDNEKLVLKIININTGYDILDLRIQMTNFMREKLPEYLFPEVIMNKEGAYITSILDSDNRKRYLLLLKYIDGRLWSSIKNHSESLLYDLGRFAGKVSTHLKDFHCPSAKRFIKWNPSEILWIKPHLNIFNKEQYSMVNHFLTLIEKNALPILDRCRKSVNHNDLSDNNILISENYYDRKIIGLIDFGDITYTNTINELAVAIAYGIMNKKEPLDAAFHIVRGYNDEFRLAEEEVEVLFYMVLARLLISVTSAELNRREHPENPYLQISANPAWDLLRRLKNVHPNYALYLFRHACSMTPCSRYAKYSNWLKENKNSIGKLINLKLDTAKVIDLSIGSLELGHNNNFDDVKTFSTHIKAIMEKNNVKVAIGRYNEARPIYSTNLFYQEGNEGPQWRTLHIGMDIFAEPGTPIIAPLDAIVHSIKNNKGKLDYGPTIILQHQFDDFHFYTLYGHLSSACLLNLHKGDKVSKGQQIASIGNMEENGGWPPHLHFQIILDMLNYDGDYPGVALYKYKQLWNSICPNPAEFLGLTQKELITEELSPEEITTRRKMLLGRNLSISYRKPLKIVRGYMQYLYDHAGRKYLDTINNVAHVGHQHPRIVNAAIKQLSVLNTNTRYLHENIIKYAEELCHKLPKELNVCYFVNSGSEANELALRMARTFTGKKDIIILEMSYHGNTGACIEISDYKFSGPGGKGPEPYIHVAPLPDVYKGIINKDDPHAGEKYALYIKNIIDDLKSKGKGIAAFICESLPSCAGQIIFPPNYLKNAFKYVREFGGVCIIDEVQVGFGRVGSAYWGFELQDVVPDIITLGKPIGNGHPLGAVITTSNIAEAFNNGMEYFNTFGGNPVSCAIGREVLKVIEEEKLQENAYEVGKYLLRQLAELQKIHPDVIGDVRGIGLFIGIELVNDPILKTPDAKKANYIINYMKERGILCSTEGKHNNVIKFKPPLVFTKQNADFYIETLDEAIKDTY
jgi:4-aminobutyrate aminotransferase-like enzyme/Ser/Thr protein kinase RdoA (MazF antagonist)